MLTVAASVGARMNELEALDATGSQKGLSYTKSLSDLENLDYYSGASQLAFRQVALQAASAAFMTIQGSSLFSRKCAVPVGSRCPAARRPRRTLPAPRRASVSACGGRNRSFTLPNVRKFHACQFESPHMYRPGARVVHRRHVHLQRRGLDGVEFQQRKLEQINKAYGDQASQLSRAYSVFLRARLVLSTSLMDMQQGKTEQAGAQAKRSEGLMRDGYKMLDTFRKVPRLAGSEAQAAALESAFKEFDGVIKRQAAALTSMAIQDYLDLNDTASAANSKFREAIDGYLAFVDAHTDALAARAERDHNTARMVTIAMLAIAVILALGCWVFINRTVLRPLHEAGGHFDKIAGGDFTGRVEVRSTNEIGSLFAAIKRMQESLTRTVSAVRRGVDEINVGSREISAGNTDLSSRTEQQAASGRDGGLDGAVGLDRQAERGQRTSGQSAGGQRVGRGRTRRFGGVGSGDDDAGDLGQLAQDFRDRVGDRWYCVPDQHPGAERGGGSGAGGRARQGLRGGGGRSALAGAAQRAGGQEIKGLIEDSVGKVGAGSQQVERAGATMQEIVASVKRVTDIMGEISAASEEQSSGIDQVNRAVSQMDEVTQQNAALVEEPRLPRARCRNRRSAWPRRWRCSRSTPARSSTCRQQLAQQRRAPRRRGGSGGGAESQEPAIEPPQPPAEPPAGAARDADRPPAAEAASTVRPLRRPAARKAEATDVTPVTPAAPSASRRARRTMIGSLSDERSASWH